MLHHWPDLITGASTRGPTVRFRLPFHRSAAGWPAWTWPGHFRVGDPVCFADGRPATVAYIDGQRIGVYSRSRLGAWTLDDNDLIRHAHSFACRPCRADNERRAVEEERLEASHRDQFDARERNVWEAIRNDMVMVGYSVQAGPCPSAAGDMRYRFGPNSPVKPWMRTEFDGHMLHPECPSLSLGRIWDPLDWPRIEAAYLDDGLSLDNPGGDGLTWPTIRQAFLFLRENDLAPALDVNLEMRLLDDGVVGVEVWPSQLLVRAAVPDPVERYVSDLLGSGPDSHPHSALIRPGFRDRPGYDFTAPYDPYTFPHTTWSWA